MDTHLLALQLMAAQGLLGAFDTIYHHELTEALPSRKSARKELAIHAARALIYAALFTGLSCWVWNGWLAVLLVAIFAVEIILTLWDFVVEDKTRLLPPSERITHTILAINGGAFITLLALNVTDWFAQPTGLQWSYHGYLSWFLGLCGLGVAISGMRDGIAAYSMRKNTGEVKEKIHFSEKSRSVLVTGGTGFIGKLLVRALLADGQRVTLLTRNPKSSAWLFDGRVNCISAMEQLPKNFPIDVVINLAGARILGWRWTPARQQVLRDSRIGLTKKIINWISVCEHKPSLFLTASAIGYYGIQKIDDNTELTEESCSQSIFMASLCRDWEQVAQTAGQYGVKVAAMRFGLVLGQGGALPMMLLPIKLGMGGALGSGKQWLSWIHVADLLRGIAHLWQMNEAGKSLQAAYNFTAPETLHQIDFSKTAAALLHRPCIIPTPAWPMHLLLGEQADLLLEGQRVVPTNLLTEKFEFRYPTLEAALRSLL